MTKGKTTKFRSAAEARLMERTLSNPADYDSADRASLLHELQVHQIELEMQNEELRGAQRALEESRDRYADLYEFAPVGYLTLSHDGVIDEINMTGAAMLGVERKKLRHQRLDRFISPGLREVFHHHVQEVLNHDSKATLETIFQRHNAQKLYVQMDCRRFARVDTTPMVRIALTDVTERAVLLRSLREKDHLLSASQRVAKIGSWSMSFNANALRWSDETYRIFGVTPDTFVPTVEKVISLIHQRDRPKVQEWIRAGLAGDPPKELEFRVIRPDASIMILLCRGQLQYAHEGTAPSLVGTFQDITERKQVEQQQSIAATAFDAQEGMTVTDTEGTILKVNAAFTRITGYSSEEAVGQNPRILKSGRQGKEFYARMWDQIKRTGAWEGEIWNRRKSGEIYPEYLTITAVKDSTGVETNYVATFNDITLSKASAEEIKNLAFYDPLTKLPNRRLLFDRLKSALASICRTHSKGSLLFIDLDNFKELNDTEGHDVGDLLLQQVGERLVSCVREGDTVARLGGDEFVVMLENLSKKDIEAATQTELIAKKILVSLNQPYQLKDKPYANSPSVGITMITGNDNSIEELLKQADIAMYQAKEAGRNTVRFYDPQMQESIRALVKLELDLREAIEDEEFVLHYQIQVDSNNNPVGAEALIRWEQPERGLVLPSDFIGHAEASGRILKIGDWVLQSACQLLNAWQKNEATGDLVLSINVSAKQFHQTEFVGQVKDAIKNHGVNPNRLKLELTESVLLIDMEDTISKMQELNKCGIRLSLDDFGTGYSSLQYLKRLPLEQLKIDKSFIRDIETDSDDRAIVSTIIAMAGNLKLEVIAEGVETEAQRQFLTERGCTRFQGYLFGRPQPIEQFLASLGPV